MELIEGDGDGVFAGLPDLTGDGESNLDDVVLFAAATDDSTVRATAQRGCGCALMPVLLILVALVA